MIHMACHLFSSTIACVAVFSVSFQASGSRVRAWRQRWQKISCRGGGAGKERKSLLPSPDIFPNASNCFRSLGASTVTRDPIILTSGKLKTTKIALKKCRGMFVSAHLKRSLEVSLKRKDIYLAKIYSSLPTEKIVVELC